MADNVKKPKRADKRKVRGCIRERTWLDKTGAKSTAWQADFGRVNAQRIMRSFDTKAAAENWLHQQRTQLAAQGRAAFQQSDNERMDAIRAREKLDKVPGLPKLSPLETAIDEYVACREKLGRVGGTLPDAVDFYVKHRPAEGKSRTVAELVEEFIRDAEENKRRPRTVKDIRLRLAKFSALFGDRQVATITSDDADKWVRQIDAGPLTRLHYRVVAHGLFNYAIDQGCYGAENPFRMRRLRRKPSEDERMPTCMKPDEVQKVMAAAVEVEPLMVPSLAIGFFAGLRTSEIEGQDWKDIDLDQRLITVQAAVAKKRRTRHVTIEDNLLAWLIPYRKKSGPVASSGKHWRSQLDSVKKQAKVAWTHNAMRHSYASHHLVKYGDAGKTAMQLGHHNDTSQLYSHYRALVTPTDAAKYWAIRPAIEGNVFQFKSA